MKAPMRNHRNFIPISCNPEGADQCDLKETPKKSPPASRRQDPASCRLARRKNPPHSAGFRTDANAVDISRKNGILK